MGTLTQALLPKSERRQSLAACGGWELGKAESRTTDGNNGEGFAAVAGEPRACRKHPWERGLSRVCKTLPVEALCYAAKSPVATEPCQWTYAAKSGWSCSQSGLGEG